jgi:hypothetical protein
MPLDNNVWWLNKFLYSCFWGVWFQVLYMHAAKLSSL